MEIILSLLEAYGLPIAFIAVLIWGIIYLAKFINRIYQDQNEEKQQLMEALKKSNEVNERCVEQLANIDSRLSVIESQLLS